mmetsp:Transcript_58347/g.155968  ORF Transcript_58347/g.155968 Transcript_58347/m.155968 type:complete len:261 (+) Transcript_58347:1577-2359(+)
MLSETSLSDCVSDLGFEHADWLCPATRPGAHGRAQQGACSLVASGFAGVFPRRCADEAVGRLGVVFLDVLDDHANDREQKMAFSSNYTQHSSGVVRGHNCLRDIRSRQLIPEHGIAEEKDFRTRLHCALQERAHCGVQGVFITHVVGDHDPLRPRAPIHNVVQRVRRGATQDLRLVTVHFDTKVIQLPVSSQPPALGLRWVRFLHQLKQKVGVPSSGMTEQTDVHVPRRHRPGSGLCAHRPSVAHRGVLQQLVVLGLCLV